MFIQSVHIQNFRSLEDVRLDFQTKASVIVGPNAAGKTTILEAIRLVKSILAPRTASEAANALFSLGIASPHVPNRLRIEAIARNSTLPVVISCRFRISNVELELLKSSLDSIARSIIQARLGQNVALDALVAYLASPEGNAAFTSIKAAVATSIESISRSLLCHLELTVDMEGGLRATSDPIETQLVAFIERNLTPYKSAFTYFPADRALPSGDQPVQLGGPDASQQLESYNSQPQIKFNRLKNTIFTASIFNGVSPSDRNIGEEFERIFQGILKGRHLERLEINEIGLLNVLIKDLESRRIFDLDGMSSGEKGLILTFLLISRTVVNGGIVLLDEPELHLNPAVCKDLLEYMVDEFAKKKDIQVIICSHSPEILAAAFDNSECTLFHLKSSTNVSRVRAQDEANLMDALKRLGASESENLLYKGVIFVEGPDDITMLEAGFGPILKRYKLKYSIGRNEVERAITSLQSIEKNQQLPSVTYFIFDRDEQRTDKRSSDSVKVLQWNRRCLENYLLDLECLVDVVMSSEVMVDPFPDEGTVNKTLQSLASRQLDELAARNVYATYKFESAGLRKADLHNKTIDEIGSNLMSRIEKAKASLSSINEATWLEEFYAKVREEKKRLESIWFANWKIDCDGKRLLEDLWRERRTKVSLKKFKTLLMQENARNQSEPWRSVESQLRQLMEI